MGLETLLEENQCPICGKRAKVEGSDAVKFSGTNRECYTVYKCDCKICGKYEIRGWNTARIFKQNMDRKYALSWRTREASEQGTPIVFTGDTLYEIKNSMVMPKEFEVIDQILRYVYRHKPWEYRQLNFDTDYYLAYDKTPEEFEHYLTMAIERGYLKKQILGVKLDCKGYDRVEELKKKELKSNQVFVAMWFNEKLEPAYNEGIEPAIRETGYIPKRIDKESHIDKIDDKILSMIKESGFLVADFTGQRGGVYFEAGFARALDKPIIWSCHKDDIDKLHFDTRQINHIVWETPEDLKKQLITSINNNVTYRNK